MFMHRQCLSRVDARRAGVMARLEAAPFWQGFLSQEMLRRDGPEQLGAACCRMLWVSTWMRWSDFPDRLERLDDILGHLLLHIPVLRYLGLLPVMIRRVLLSNASYAWFLSLAGIGQISSTLDGRLS